MRLICRLSLRNSIRKERITGMSYPPVCHLVQTNRSRYHLWMVTRAIRATTCYCPFELFNFAHLGCGILSDDAITQEDFTLMVPQTPSWVSFEYARFGSVGRRQPKLGSPLHRRLLRVSS
jgi:hypothetical protein